MKKEDLFLKYTHIQIHKNVYDENVASSFFFQNFDYEKFACESKANRGEGKKRGNKYWMR